MGRTNVLAVAIVVMAPLAAKAEQPLHVQVDRLIEQAAADVQLQPRSDDSEFLRRVYLDLAGRIPTAAEAREFFDNKKPGRRGQLIDRLLSGDDYPRRMQELFNAMLMERRGEHDEWTRFLRLALAANMPWDQIARSILHPDAGDESRRGAAFFFTQRLVAEGAMAPVDVPGLTRDVGRLFAGIDLQCAQCHDHLYIHQYKQRDFQGLHTIFENVQTRRDLPFPAIGQKVMTAKKEFMSVFTQVPMQVGPLVPGGEEVQITTFAKGEEFAEPPDRKKRTPGVPKFSPLGELASGLATGENQLFARNIVNRLWFVMMGRGLVQPLDLLHAENPPSHPELLDLLAGEFAAHDFNIKWLIAELARSETYQRTTTLAAGDDLPDGKTYAVAHEKRLSAEQLFWSTLLATGEFARQRQLAEKNKPGDSDKVATKSGDPPSTEKDAAAPPAVELSELERLVAGSQDLQSLQKQFIDTFANPPKEPEVDFEPSVKAALFLMHDERVLKLLESQPGNLIDRLAKLSDNDKIADELFLAIASRPPTEADRRDVAEYLAKNEQRRTVALGHLAWALLTSTEFCVNH